jgi:hypothetical protein
MRWLDRLPKHGNPVGAVWSRLTELEDAGHDPTVIAALRSLLMRHQPPRYGRCPACPRGTWLKLWRRRPWPCMVWGRVHFELLGRGQLEL